MPFLYKIERQINQDATGKLSSSKKISKLNSMRSHLHKKRWGQVSSKASRLKSLDEKSKVDIKVNVLNETFSTDSSKLIREEGKEIEEEVKETKDVSNSPKVTQKSSRPMTAYYKPQALK